MGNAKPKNKGKGSKLVINFDENARADYLTGFHKRKVERQQVASKNAEEKVKEEKRRKRAELKAKLKELRTLTGADFSAAGIEDEDEEGVDGAVQQYSDEETVTTVVTTVVQPIALGVEEWSDDDKVGLDKEELERQTKIQNAKEAIRNIKQNISLLPGKPQTAKQKLKGSSGHHKRQGPWKQAQKGKKSGHAAKSNKRPGAAPSAKSSKGPPAKKRKH